MNRRLPYLLLALSVVLWIAALTAFAWLLAWRADGATTVINGPSARHTVISGASAPNDSYESYTDGADAGGLNGGVGWNGAYVDGPGSLGIQNNDSAEGYTDAATLDTLNGGVGWNGPYVSD